MKGRQIAGWALAASVLVGVPVGGVMYLSLPVLAQRALAGINRGLLYASQGRDAEARQIWTESIGLLEQALGRNHPDVLKMRQAIATYAQQQKLTPSNSPPVSSQRTTVPSSALQEAERLNELGIEQSQKGQYAQAQQSFERSLAIREQALGRNHPDVAQSLNNLAALYWSQNQTELALTRFIRALDIEETNLALYSNPK